jgi:hypothetical protein
MIVTFDNENILDYFEGNSNKAPLEELKYIMDNDIRISFVNQVSDILRLADEKVKVKNVKGIERGATINFLEFVAGVAGSKTPDGYDDEKLTRSMEALKSLYSTARTIQAL